MILCFVDYLTQPNFLVVGMVLVEQQQAMWLAAHYHERYRRGADGWLIEHLKLDVKRFSPYEAGFGQIEIADLPA